MTPWEKFPRLVPFYEEIEKRQDEHIPLVDRIVTAAQGAFFLSDIFMVASLKRSWDLTAGILLLVDSWNFLASAPLLRLQIDSLAKLHFIAHLTIDPNDFLKQLMEGERWDKVCDPMNPKKRLTDRYLIEQCASTYPWIESFYTTLSGLVHFSKRHLHSVFTIGNNDPAVGATLVMQPGEPDWTEDELIEMLGNTLRLCDALLKVGEGWVIWKQAYQPPQQPETSAGDGVDK